LQCCVEATNKKLLKNLHSASLPPQSLGVFAFKNIMKKRVRILGSEFTSKLEEMVNNFLSANLDIDLIDIKYSDSQSENGYWCSALIIYTTDNV